MADRMTVKQELRALIATLQQGLAESSAQIEQLQSENMLTQNANAALRADVERLTSENALLRTEISTLNAAIVRTIDTPIS